MLFSLFLGWYSHHFLTVLQEFEPSFRFAESWIKMSSSKFLQLRIKTTIKRKKCNLTFGIQPPPFVLTSEYNVQASLILAG